MPEARKDGLCQIEEGMVRMDRVATRVIGSSALIYFHWISRETIINTLW